MCTTILSFMTLLIVVSNLFHKTMLIEVHGARQNDRKPHIAESFYHPNLHPKTPLKAAYSAYPSHPSQMSSISRHWSWFPTFSRYRAGAAAEHKLHTATKEMSFLHCFTLSASQTHNARRHITAAAAAATATSLESFNSAFRDDAVSALCRRHFVDK